MRSNSAPLLILAALCLLPACSPAGEVAVPDTEADPAPILSLESVTGLAALDFLIGEWSIDEKEYDEDGTLIEHIQDGEVVVTPILRGNWLQMSAEGDVDEALMWLFTHDGATGLINAWAFSSEYPGEIEAVGGRNSDGVFEVTPVGDLSGRLRMLVRPEGPDGVEVRIMAPGDDSWFVRTEEVWTRR